MTTYNMTDGSIAGQAKPHDSAPNSMGVFLRRNVIDLANQNVANDGSGLTALNFREGELCLGVMIRTITVDSGGGTVQVGTGLDVDQWGATLSLAATGLANAATMLVPEYFSAADTLDIIEDGAFALTTWKFEVTAILIATSDTIDYVVPGVSGSGD